MVVQTLYRQRRLKPIGFFSAGLSFSEVRTLVVRIISKRRIHEYIQQHSDAEASLLAWHEVVKSADWSNSVDIKNTLSSVDLVDGLFVFNIANNRYRLVAHVNFRGKRVYVLHILTHKEYDRGNWKS